jgi:hypothetical protein
MLSLMAKLTHGLSGAAGEFFVAAELSRQGYLATLTTKNAEGIDILAAKPNSGRALKIQVKTTQDDKPHWVLRESDEQERGPDFYYVFVCLGTDGTHPDFYIVPGNVVARAVATSHRDWLKGTARDGSPHRDSNMRGYGSPECDGYNNKWEFPD